MGLFNLITILLIAGNQVADVASLPEEKCVTELAPKERSRKPADPKEVLEAIKLMRSQSGELLFSEISEETKKEVIEYFSAPAASTSRLEQFYALLFLIGRELGDRADDLILDVPSAQQVLRVSHVFPTPEFIDSLKEAQVDFHRRRKRARWKITLDNPEMVIPLNGGLGYLAYQNGLCQKVENVVIYGGFEADISKNIDKNIVTRFDRPIDFKGRFGSPIGNIRLSIVSLFDIEFIHGTKIGVATVKISEKEFERAVHSAILRWAAMFLSTRLFQPIEW